MINISSEQLLSLITAAREFPGGSVHVATLHRWRVQGVQGVRLETVLRGGIRFTSLEAIQRFIVSTTAAADGNPDSG